MPLLAEHDLEALRPPGNPDDLVCVGYRPVFKEHTNRAGQKIGQRELSRITNRCNERVMDTGDFSPLVVGHTRDDGSKDPEVIGFVGPYRMGKVGNLHPKHATEGKVWVFRHQLETLKKYPRLSVEFWADEQDPGNGYFDPISLLGAETPELDLGVHYAKNRDGVRLMKYSKVERFQAAAPSGSNTFVPGMVGGGKSDERDEDRDESGTIKQQYDKESSDMATLNAADIQQIVAALTPVCKQIMSEMQSSNKGETQPGGDDLGDDLDLDNDPDLDVGDDLDGMDEGDADGLGDEDADGIPDDEDSDDDGDGIPEIDDEDSDLGLGDDSDLEDADEPPGDDSDLDDDSDDDETEPFDKSDEDKEPKMADKPDDKKKPVKFSKEPILGMTVEKYAKENAELRERYEKSIAETRATKEELATLKTRIDAIETEKKKAVRYSKLNDLRSQGFVVDVAEELADTEPLNDEQFAKHCTKIVEKYARAPIGASLYVPASDKYDGNSPAAKVERYSKVAGDVAKEIQARTGKVPDYQAIRANVERNDGKYVPAA